MARRDVINFSSLKKAIEQRYRFRNDPNNINYKIFRGIPFEPQTDPHSIFGWIYSTFRELIRTKHFNLNQYLNIEDKSVLEKLFKNLERDPNLRFLNIPDAALNDSGYELSDQYYLKQSKEIAEAQQAEQMASAAAPSGSSTGGMPGMPSFSAPSIATRPRMVRNIPQAEAEGQKLFVANSSGAIVGEKEITPTSIRSVPQGPSEFHITDRQGNIVETYSKEPISTHPKTETPPQTQLVTARSDGTIIKGPEKEISPQPKLVVTDRHGNSAPQPLKRPETAKLFTQDKNNIIREHTVKSPSRFSGFKSSLKNIGSKAGVFFQRNIGKHLTGDRAISFLGKAGNTGINALSGISNFGGRPGGVFSHLGRFNRNNGGRGFFGRMGGGGPGGGKKSGLSSGKKWAMVGTGIFFLIFIMGVMGGGTGTPGQNPTAPITNQVTDLSTCKFTRSDLATPIRSSTLQNLISRAAVTAGIPAPILASVAMHESDTFVSIADDNHDAIKTNQYCIKGKMFCEKDGQVLHSIKGKDNPCTTEEIASGARNAQAVGLMQHLDIYNPGKDLCSITESLAIAAAKLKADGITAQPTKDQVDKAIKAYYNSCNYGSFSYCDEVWDDYQNCQTTVAPISNCLISGGACPLVSCPVSKDGSGSFNKICGTSKNPGSNGCGHGVLPVYPTCKAPPYAICPYSDQLKAAIDVRPAGSNGNKTSIYLPFINGNSVNWTLVSGPITLNGGAWGVKLEYKAVTADGKQLQLDLTHLDPNIDLGASKSGDKIGITKEGFDEDGGSHLHTAISINGAWLDSISEIRICSP